MCHTVIWDVQYGKILVNYDTAYYVNDTSLVDNDSGELCTYNDEQTMMAVQRKRRREQVM
jgi:hypothetical protein